jgi:glycosyltransferase involved in cell wall biosynthesis
VPASRLPGLDEAVVDGEHGVLVPPGDPVALADALHSLLRSADLRRHLSEAARERGELYGVESIGARYVAL